MAFEPVYEIAKLDSMRKLCSGQAVVEARLIPQPGAAITRVLSTSCSCSVAVTEVFAGEARYNGRVNFKVLYVDEGGSNHSMDYNADFTDKITDEKISAGVKVKISGRILDTDIVSVSEGEIKLAAVVESELMLAASDEVKYLSGGGENIYTNDDRIDYCRLAAEANDNFIVTDNVADVKVVKILLAEAKAVTLKRTAGADSVTLEGIAVCDLCCETSDGLIASYRTETPFTQEAAAIGARADNVVVGDVKLNSFNATFETDGETSNIAVEYNLNLSACVYAEEVINPIVDAFSVTNEILSTGESVTVYRNRLCTTVSDRVEGSVTLDVNMPIVDNIMAATAAKVNISNAYADGGKLTLEGVVSAGIVYYCAEANSKNSVAVELPFSITTPANVSGGDAVTAGGEVTNVAVKIRRGNEIDIKADICISVSAVTADTRYIITELQLGEERELPSGAVSIHIAKAKETLWDVAKAMGTTPELVLLQNPNLTLPLSGGERIIAYRHLARG